MRLFFIVLFAAVAAFHAAAAPAAADLASQAEVIMHNPEASAEEIAGAIDRYNQLLSDYGLRSGALFFNLGNAYARTGDHANAILNYRRALLHTPNDIDLLANLRSVRNQRQDHFAEPEAARVLKTLFFWHYDCAFKTRLALAIAAGLVFWVCAAALLWLKTSWLKATAATALLVTAVFGASAAIEAINLRRQQPAVVMAAEVTPRQGDADAYPAAFDAPIHAATEVNIRRSRGEWSEIVLPNGLSGWVRNRDIERI